MATVEEISNEVINTTFSVFDTLQNAEDSIIKYEMQTSSKFSTFKKDKTFSVKDFELKNHKILFEDKKNKFRPSQQIMFSGVPFIIVGSKHLDCTHGVNHTISRKMRNQAEKLKAKDTVNSATMYAKSRFLSQDTKKMNCPAKITIRDVVYFPDFKAEANTERRKRTVAEKLKEDWSNKKETFNFDRKIVVNFPLEDEHKGHLVGKRAGLSLQVDSKIISKIYQLVGEGIRNPREMQRSIRVYVKDELFRGLELPPTSSRRYYPKIQDIRNHMYKAATKLKFSKLDQENLQQKVEEWRNKYPRDKFYYRGYGEVTDHSKELEVSEKFNRENEEDIFSNVLPTKQKLIFIHQTISQKELLYKYGNHICLLDATYKSTRYSIPLFFVVVKTNSNYQVVASFAVQDETTDTITEALKKLSQWNPEWNPKCFMTDNCEAEILSIENVFKDCFVILCDFHREQAWERWLSANANGMRSVKHTALCLLRRIAASETQEEYDIAIQALHKDPIWISTNSIKFKNYIENTWLPEKKRWVKAFRSGILETVVNTNNGVERKNRDFKHEFLNQYKDNSLSGMVTVLVDQFIPETYSRYVEANIRRCSDYRLYNSNLPKWLCNKPENFTRHCIEKIGLVKDCNNLKITFHENSKNKQMYEVKSFTSAKSYIVTIGGQDTKFPDCQCIEWKKTLMPCKHMVAIFQHCDGVSWDLLPDSY
nr:uncharacterized protein LOC105844598 [Hydra vulgaris]